MVGATRLIKVKISFKQKSGTRDGFQMICKDRSTNQIRSWTFDDQGSFGESA